MQSRISKYTVNYFNDEEFHSIKREIFTNDCYYFESDSPKPLIIDVGSYIGLSILYFKQLYPQSKIIAFEPNRVTFDMLKENMFINNITGVDLHNTAILDKKSEKEMYIDNSGMNRFSVASFNKNAWNRKVKSKKVIVKTERLDKYLNVQVDMLKLDVEGSEQIILKSVGKYLSNIRNISLEYHPTGNQDFDKIINMLKRQYDIEILYEGKILKRNIPKDKLLTIRAIDKG